MEFWMEMAGAEGEREGGGGGGGGGEEEEEDEKEEREGMWSACVVQPHPKDVLQRCPR